MKHKMTKEEAIEILKNTAWLGTNEDRVKTEEAVAMAIQALEHASTIEAVSVGTLEQFKWERDVALKQLEEIGKGLGSKMDDVVTIVRCEDCRHYKHSAVADRKMCFRKDVDGVQVCYDFQPNDFCKYGKRRTEVEE